LQQLFRISDFYKKLFPHPERIRKSQQPARENLIGDIEKELCVGEAPVIANCK